MTSPRTIKGQARAWSPDMDSELRRYIKGGYSFAEAVAELNQKFGTSFSRNAAIGRAYRIGIEIVRLPKASKPAKPRRQKSAVFRPRPEIVIPIPVVAVDPRYLDLIDLKDGDCRFPLGTGPYTFCGNPKCEGSSYCQPHRMVCEGTGTVSERSVAPIHKRKSVIEEAA